jgi:hypothetical protein
VILSFTAANLSVLLYFNKFVLDLGSLLEARYLNPIGGVLLGNAFSAPTDSCKHCNSRLCLSARNDDRADPGRCKSSSCDQIPDIYNDCYLRICGNEHDLSILTTTRTTFDEFRIVKKEIYKEKGKQEKSKKEKGKERSKE